MATPLLRTKLHIPPVRPELVPRPRLIERLSAGLDGSLTLISAPAGFGKTTLLAQWFTHCERSDPRVRFAWLSLDRRDNDPARFWRYVVAALQTVHPRLGESIAATLQPFQPSSTEGALAALINEIAATCAERLVLVLDDFHLIAERQIHEGLAFLLDNLPPPPAGVHLIISGRADLPWPIARLRARGELTEIRSADLRFTPEEVSGFLNGVAALDLSPDNIARLDARTEGWIAGLQLVAISLRERKRSHGTQGVSSAIEAFAASHRFILDYLVEEVLDQQPPPIHEFLLQTSVLDQLTASLCDAVTAGSESQATLEQLERSNLFLLPLDEERRWYRYHHLFADLLRSHLRRAEPDQEVILHRRASNWYEQNGLIASAVYHALLAGDVDRVARLGRRNALVVMDYDELGSLVSWLDRLSEEELCNRPWLGITSAWAHLYVGRLDAVQSRLHIIEAGLPRAQDAQDLAGHIAAIRCYVAAAKGDMPEAQSAADEALRLLPEHDQAMRGFVGSLRSAALRWTGDLVAAAGASVQAVSVSRASRDRQALIVALAIHATLLHTQGQLHQAFAVDREALLIADEYARQQGREPPIAASVHRLLGRILYEWNDLDEALRHVKRAMDLSEGWGGVEDLAFTFTTLARVLQATGDEQGALDAIERGRQNAGALSQWVDRHAAAHEARLRLLQGNQAGAAHWAHERGLRYDDDPEFQYAWEYSVLARLLTAQGNLDPALTLLDKLLNVVETAGAHVQVIETLVLQALALQQKGHQEQALYALSRALSLAEEEGFVRTFVDEGEPIGKLLREAARKGIATEYAVRLLAALEEGRRQPGVGTQDPTPLPRTRSEPPPEPLVEPLSDREQEVLRLLDTHLSTPEIAQELVISWHTVRTHIKHIYGKLGAHNRADAVQLARELGLI